MWEIAKVSEQKQRLLASSIMSEKLCPRERPIAFMKNGGARARLSLRARAVQQQFVPRTAAKREYEQTSTFLRFQKRNNLKRNAICEGRVDAAQKIQPESPDWESQSYWTPSKTQRPRLFLAPMEGLGDKNFRAAIAAAFPASFDEATTEFLRLTLPDNLPSDGRKAARCYEGMLRSFGYHPQELNRASSSEAPRRPIALQLMLGGDQADIGRGFVQWMFSDDGLEPSLRPPRIDINMGCPSKCTTSRGAKLPGGGTKRKGAGSSLLRDPEDVAAVAGAIREGLSLAGCQEVCLSVKMRTGFDDEALFEANLLAAAEHADFIQIHGRTKADGYHQPARWDRIRQAKEMLHGSTSCRIVGNGDITDADQAMACVQESGADGIMIGRAAVSNPYLFYDIRSKYGDDQCNGFRMSTKEHAEVFFETYYSTLQANQKSKPGTARFEKTACSKLKQMLAQGFLLNLDVTPPGLVADMNALLRSSNPASSQALYDSILNGINKHL